MFVMANICANFKSKLIIATHVTRIYILQRLLQKDAILTGVVSNYSHYLRFLWKHDIELFSRSCKVFFKNNFMTVKGT